MAKGTPKWGAEALDSSAMSLPVKMGLEVDLAGTHNGAMLTDVHTVRISARDIGARSSREEMGTNTHLELYLAATVEQ